MNAQVWNQRNIRTRSRYEEIIYIYTALEGKNEIRGSDLHKEELGAKDGLLYCK